MTTITSVRDKWRDRLRVQNESTDPPDEFIVDLMMEFGADLRALDVPPAGDAVDPHLSARGTDAGSTREKTPHSPASQTGWQPRDESTKP